MKVVIREATNKDLNDMMTLIKGAVEYHHNIDKYYKPFHQYNGLDKYTKDQLKDKNVKILLAEDKGDIIGRIVGVVVKALPYVKPNKIGKIDEAFILKNYRHKKVGEKLFKELLEWFKQKKVKHIQLSVDARNKLGVRAWRRYGFHDYRLEMRQDL